MTFHEKPPIWRQFSWNVGYCFQDKKKKKKKKKKIIFQNVDCWKFHPAYYVLDKKFGSVEKLFGFRYNNCLGPTNSCHALSDEKMQCLVGRCINP